MSVAERVKRVLGPCRHYLGEWDGYCGQPSVHRYQPGDRCAEHTPSALAGMPEPNPDPEMSLEGIRRAKLEGR